MSNNMTFFNKVSRSGDIMTGDLRMNYNSIFFTDITAAYGASLTGSPTIANALMLLSRTGVGYGTLYFNGGHAYGNLGLAAAKTVDGIDVSEIGKPAGGLHLGSNQLNISDSTRTVVQLDTIYTNFADSIEDTGAYKITPAVAGFYVVIAQVTFSSVVADKLYRAIITRNGSVIHSEARKHASLADVISVRAANILYLNNTEYIQLEAYHEAGVATVDIDLGSAKTFLTLQRLRT